MAQRRAAAAACGARSSPRRSRSRSCCSPAPGLAARSFDRLLHVDPGFQPGGVLTFRITLPDATYPTMASYTQFYRDYVERIRAGSRASYPPAP